ncbi:MAG TPA: hypothetical protein VEH29_04085, partial [Acidimicrobiales bacterium]|nr:hypothetical protein [Acidimicrobiales bacterium]
MSRTIFKGLRHLRASKETEADAGPSVPSQRALDALADAVRRAREATDATGVGDPMRAASSYPRPTAPAAPKPVGDATARRAGSLPLGVDAT